MSDSDEPSRPISMELDVPGDESRAADPGFGAGRGRGRVLRFLSAAREALAWILVLGITAGVLGRTLIAHRYASETIAWVLAALGVAGVLCHRRLRWLGTATLSFMALVPTPRQYFGHVLSHQLFEDLEAEGKELYRCLETFRDRTGRWPASFEEAGCSPEPNVFGGWQPTLDDACRVWVGDYGKDGFTLYLHPERGWYLDC